MTFQSINWEVPGKALATLDHSTTIFIIKFAHEHLPTRKHMKRIGEAESDKCPSCLHTVEDSWHILSCPERTTWRTTFNTALTDTLDKIHTQPDLNLILLKGVRGALNDPNFQMDATNRETKFQELIYAQNFIGWDHLLKGRLSHHWLQCQQLHI
jgi:hypothetical protein